ncbi:hypothetical protein B0J12DRAFT_160520 [Macrophomina phaseolina]|uniref:Secreted protein n=1 Tax=Macrophomina phaseolina TaxID=35725 RepID=A0ABQ8GRQ6_9PEZI|nr:hypothetical protein B0J12DRAFT_160520 [Macrophomina phaseolina]
MFRMLACMPCRLSLAYVPGLDISFRRGINPLRLSLALLSPTIHLCFLLASSPDLPLCIGRRLSFFFFFFFLSTMISSSPISHVHGTGAAQRKLWWLRLEIFNGLFTWHARLHLLFASSFQNLSCIITDRDTLRHVMGNAQENCYYKHDTTLSNLQ